MRARHTAQPIVRGLQTVDGHTHTIDACGFCCSCALCADTSPARGHRGRDTEALELTHDLEPIITQVSFAADERGFTHAELCHLPNQIQAFGRAQLARALVPRARPAMAASEIARQGDLPNRVNWLERPIRLARLRQRQVPARGRCMRRNRQLPRSRLEHLLRALRRRHRIMLGHSGSIAALVLQPKAFKGAGSPNLNRRDKARDCSPLAKTETAQAPTLFESATICGASHFGLEIVLGP